MSDDQGSTAAEALPDGSGTERDPSTGEGGDAGTEADTASGGAADDPAPDGSR